MGCSGSRTGNSSSSGGGRRRGEGGVGSGENDDLDHRCNHSNQQQRHNNRNHRNNNYNNNNNNNSSRNNHSDAVQQNIGVTPTPLPDSDMLHQKSAAECQCSCSSLNRKQDERKNTESVLSRKKSEKSEEEFYSRVKANLWRSDNEHGENVDLSDLSRGIVNINSRIPINILLVFGKPGKQYRSICSAASPNAGFAYETAHSLGGAVESFNKHKRHMVIVDARCTKHLDAVEICKTLRAQETAKQCVIVALTQRIPLGQDEPPMKPLFDAGFNTRIIAPNGRMSWLNELQALRHGLVGQQFQAVSTAALFKVVENVGHAAVSISNQDHRIQYVNPSYENMFGFKYVEVSECHDDSELTNEAKNVIAQQLQWFGKVEVPRKNLPPLQRNVQVFPIVNHMGDIWHYVTLYSEPKVLLPESRNIISHRKGSLSETAAISKIATILEEVRMNSESNKQSDGILLAIEMLEGMDGITQHLRPRQVKGDQMTTELVGGLITMPKIIRELPEKHTMSKAKLRSSIPNETLPELNPEMISTLQEALTWKMDIIRLEKLSGQRPLLYLGWQVLQAFSILDFLRVSESVVINWLTEMEANYHAANPYHNSTHAADVMQATAYFLNAEPCKYVFDDLESIAAILAAIVHDLDHPGKTNAFLVNARFPLAILYNDSAVLESHHISLCFQIMKSHPELDIFNKLNRDDYMAVRQTMIDMVLATDMTKHFEHLNKFHIFMADVQKEEPTDRIAQYRIPESRTIIKRLIIKCADVSNPVRPLHICKVWASRIADEYCAQTMEERKRCIPIIMPIFDNRSTCNVPKSQTSFIDFFINDLYTSFNSLCPLPELMQLLTSNYRHWKAAEQHHIQKMAQRDSGKHKPSTLATTTTAPKPQNSINPTINGPNKSGEATPPATKK